MSCKAHVPFLLNYEGANSFIASLSYKIYNSCQINAITDYDGGNTYQSNIRNAYEDEERSFNNDSL